MDSKKKFQSYINNFEKNNITPEELKYLNAKAEEYRNVELPAKWNEMKHKLHFTKEVVHFKAWYYGLKQGRYKNVVANVKVYIIKKIIKNILAVVEAKNKTIDFKKFNVVKLLETDNISELKKSIKKLYEILEKKEFSNDPVFEIFDMFYLYYLYINYDLNLERTVYYKLFDKLSGIKTTEAKLNFIAEEKNEIQKTINDENLKNSFVSIFDSLIHLYNILNDKAGNIKPAKGNTNKEVLADFQEKELLVNIIKNKNLSFEKQLDLISEDFIEKDLDYKAYQKQFEAAGKLIEGKENKNKIKEIIDVIRRLEKEVEPLLSIESKLSRINDWIKVDYKDQDYIIDVLKKEINRFFDFSGKEGGLLTKLLSGMDDADDKIKYLKESLKNLEFRLLIPTINNLINNIKKELKVDKENINEEWIEQNFENKNEDEKLEWLKVRKYWDKYEGLKEVIENEFQKTKSIVLKEGTYKPLDSFIEIAKTALTLSGQAERQKYIKFQMENNDEENKSLHQILKLIFYLFSTDSDEPKKRVLALADRIKLSIPEKQKFLQLLKTAKENETFLKETLDINDDKIAFGAIYVLFSTDQVAKRLKKLEDFLKNANENAVKYKEFFGINDALISEVIKFINDNFVKKQGEKTVQAEVNENLIAGKMSGRISRRRIKRN